jgi:hypothetical protein
MYLDVVHSLGFAMVKNAGEGSSVDARVAGADSIILE